MTLDYDLNTEIMHVMIDRNELLDLHYACMPVGHETSANNGRAMLQLINERRCEIEECGGQVNEIRLKLFPDL